MIILTATALMCFINRRAAVRDGKNANIAVNVTAGLMIGFCAVGALTGVAFHLGNFVYIFAMISAAAGALVSYTIYKNNSRTELTPAKKAWIVLLSVGAFAAFYMMLVKTTSVMAPYLIAVVTLVGIIMLICGKKTGFIASMICVFLMTTGLVEGNMVLTLFGSGAAFVHFLATVFGSFNPSAAWGMVNGIDDKTLTESWIQP